MGLLNSPFKTAAPRVFVEEIKNAVVTKTVATPVPATESPKEIFTQPFLDGGNNMTWWTETRDELAKNLGVDTPVNAVNTIGKAVVNEVKQSQPVYVAPAQGTSPAMVQASIQAIAQKPASKFLLMAVVAFFAFKLLKKKR